MDKNLLRRSRHCNLIQTDDLYLHVSPNLKNVSNRRISHHVATAALLNDHRESRESPSLIHTINTANLDDRLQSALSQLCKAALVLVALPAVTLLMPPPPCVQAAHTATNMATLALNNPSTRLASDAKQVESPAATHQLHNRVQQRRQYMADLSAVIDVGQPPDSTSGDAPGLRQSSSSNTTPIMIQSMEAVGTLLFKQTMPSVVNISSSR
jgi:hypothetical protein